MKNITNVFYFLFVAGICLFLVSVIADPSLKVMTLGAVLMFPYDFIVLYSGGSKWLRKRQKQ